MTQSFQDAVSACLPSLPNVIRQADQPFLIADEPCPQCGLHLIIPFAWGNPFMPRWVRQHVSYPISQVFIFPISFHSLYGYIITPNPFCESKGLLFDTKQFIFYAFLQIQMKEVFR